MNGRKMVVLMALALAFAGATVVGAADPVAAHTTNDGNAGGCPDDGRVHAHPGCYSIPGGTIEIV